ncbi:MAG: hypothetical protein JO252_28620 [Planctomycetaceae bacterium]|nr:hypothetical protein [Planctomycetaceae bacterium]MBV8317122.1 hypothetical protein [Planctomycetaceae bacterium]MBV8607625.1 hypothetical protein [Singulisphaera sp.]
MLGNVMAVLIRDASDGSLGHLMMATGDHRTSRSIPEQSDGRIVARVNIGDGRAAQRSGPPETWRPHSRGPAG